MSPAPLTLSPDRLALPVRGVGIGAGTFGELLDGRTVLLAFLRHFG